MLSLGIAELVEIGRVFEGFVFPDALEVEIVVTLFPGVFVPSCPLPFVSSREQLGQSFLPSEIARITNHDKLMDLCKGLTSSKFLHASSVVGGLAWFSFIKA